MRRLALLLLALPLAACDGSGMNISIDTDSNGSDNSSVTIENGMIAVNGDGGHVGIKMPKIDLKTDDFDIDGLKLYPDSKLNGLNAEGNEDAGGKATVRFESPASLAKVQAWLRDDMTRQGFKFSAKGDGFTGTTGKGKSFTIDLAADGGDKTRGSVEVRGN